MNEKLQSETGEQGVSTRRRFLKVAIAALASLNALVLGIPFVKTLLSSALRKKPDWSKVTEIGELPEGQPVEVKFGSTTEDAYHYENILYSVWVVKHAADKVTVFSPICPHLGCHFLWDARIERFACPCHASVYSIDGKVLYGPAPRPLDPLPYKIENGVLFVKYERFQVGVPQQIEV
jgi:menaquinol-cytochrome c reductase iron-sulfur subunit